VTNEIIPETLSARQPEPSEIQSEIREPQSADDAYPYVEYVLRAFEGLRETPDGWQALCPAHRDHNPSLRLTIGECGRILVCCQSQGCDYKDILAAVGLHESDLFCPDDQYPMPPLAREAAGWTVSDADATYRDEVYQALLARLGLSEAHRAALRKRGLPDAAIDAAGLKTLDASAAGHLDALFQQYGDRLSAVPGFVLAKGGLGVRFATNAHGIAIPVRDDNRRVAAIKLRRDADGQGKYCWPSGGDGPSCGTPCHVPLAARAKARADGLWRLTEGPLAADVATALSDVPTVSVAGVTTWRHALPLLELLGAKRVLVAFDAPDLRQKPQVREQVAAFVRGLREVGITPAVEVWEGHKGIDDQLAAGGTTSVVPTEAVDAYLAGLDCLPPAALTAAEKAPVPDRLSAEPVAPSRLAAVLHGKPRSRVEIEFPDPVGVDEFVAGDEGNVEWLWDGYLPKGEMVLITALAKAGKSTTVAHLLGAACRGETEFLGRKLRPGFRTLIVTQERRVHWKRRAEQLGYDPGLVLFQVGNNNRSHPGKKLSPAAWEKLGAHLAKQVKARGVDLVLLDTLADFWPVEKESDSDQVTAAYVAWDQIVEAGASVLFVHHDRKSGGTEGRSARGSGQVTAYPAIALQLTRPSPDSPFRTLKAISRYDETPEELTFQRTDAGLVAVGNDAPAAAAKAVKAAGTSHGVVAFLAGRTEGATPEDYAAANNCSPKTAKRHMDQAVAAGECLRVGTGRRGAACRYFPLSA
jgi:hypothetical protein